MQSRRVANDVNYSTHWCVYIVHVVQLAPCAGTNIQENTAGPWINGTRECHDDGKERQRTCLTKQRKYVSHRFFAGEELKTRSQKAQKNKENSGKRRQAEEAPKKRAWKWVDCHRNRTAC